MGVKNSNILDENLNKAIVNEDGTINATTDQNITDANSWFCQQEDAFSKGTTSTVIKKFFDYLPRRVFLPWLTALTDAANDVRQRLVDLTDSMNNNVQKQEAVRKTLVARIDLVEDKISEAKTELETKISDEKEYLENEILKAKDELKVEISDEKEYLEGEISGVKDEMGTKVSSWEFSIANASLEGRINANATEIETLRDETVPGVKTEIMEYINSEILGGEW